MSDWLRDRLHARHCEQCDVTRALLDERDALRAAYDDLEAARLETMDQRNEARAQVERVRALADELHEERQAYTLHTSTALVARDILRSTTRRIRVALDGPNG